MRPPSVAGGGGSYVLTWDEPRITIHVSKLHADRNGGTTAELLIESAELANPHIHIGRLNLLSDTKKRLAEQLELRFATDWAVVLEQVAVHVLRREREGEPVQVLTPADTATPTRYLLSPFLPEGEVTVLFAEGGSGKSLLALLISTLVASGRSVESLGLEPTARLPVLYLDYETTSSEHLRRLKGISESLGIPPSTEIHYRRSTIPVADDADTIQRLVHEREVGFLVIDSAAPASGTDIYDPGAPVALFRALRRIGTTSLLLGHVAKGNGDATQRTPFGSVFFFNLARSVWEVRTRQTPGEDLLRLGLFHRKSNVSKLHRPMGFEFRFDGEMGPITVSPTDVQDMPGVSPDLSVGRRIERLLPESGPLRPKEIADRLQVKDDAVRAALKRLSDSGRVVHLDGGRYAVAIGDDRVSSGGA